MYGKSQPSMDQCWGEGSFRGSSKGTFWKNFRAIGPCKSLLKTQASKAKSMNRYPRKEAHKRICLWLVICQPGAQGSNDEGTETNLPGCLVRRNEHWLLTLGALWKRWVHWLHWSMECSSERRPQPECNSVCFLTHAPSNHFSCEFLCRFWHSERV